MPSQVLRRFAEVIGGPPRGLEWNGAPPRGMAAAAGGPRRPPGVGTAAGAGAGGAATSQTGLVSRIRRFFWSKVTTKSRSTREPTLPIAKTGWKSIRGAGKS